MAREFPEVFYQNFEPKLLREIKKRPIMEVKEGEDIFIEGMHVEIIPLVLEGRVMLYKLTETQERAHIYDVHQGESCVITYTTVIRNESFPARARAVEDTKIILIDKTTSERWFRKYASWRNFIMRLYDMRMHELISQNELTTIQKHEIEKKNSEIISSIRYAKRIQEALLPEPSEIKRLVPEYFIFFRPRDIVSGDFYWIHQDKDRIFIVVADATGHGVPGGFMSALGMAFIRETVQNFSGNAADFLNEVRDKIVAALSKDDQEQTLSDGMDMSLLIIYPKEKKADFAGAYNPVVIIRQGNFFEVKGDKMPIGKFFNKKSFTNKEIVLEVDDIIYMFSDGFQTQLGGDKGRKFMKRRFYKLLQEISQLDFQQQKRKLEETFVQWKGDNRQTDDITVLGIKFKK